MAESVPIYYWDSCVFLSFIDEEKERATDIEEFLSKAQDGKIRECPNLS
jgi:hypothetical protein